MAEKSIFWLVFFILFLVFVYASMDLTQVAQWNPDVAFRGSYLDVYGREKIYKNPHFQLIWQRFRNILWGRNMPVKELPWESLDVHAYGFRD